ncbi:MAG: hypothetical protein KF746_08585 [Chitinophagaceae bacterium]|nr:hypothetical protein [Chitinophagaceae bacterium]
MDIHKTIAILEALVSGRSPETGEVLNAESVLNERDVIRALQCAIDHLKPRDDTPRDHSDVDIDDEDIQTAIRLFRECNMSPTYSRLTGFFLAARSFKKDLLTSHKLYGKHKGSYQKGQLLNFFSAYLLDHDYSKHGKRIRKKELSEGPDFFQKEVFNSLSEEAIDQLKEKINELGIIKTENLADYIQKVRVKYPRSHEPWTEMEDGLLSEALQKTNDLNLLSGLFQRGLTAIERRGEKLIYQNQK